MSVYGAQQKSGLRPAGFRLCPDAAISRSRAGWPVRGPQPDLRSRSGPCFRFARN